MPAEGSAVGDGIAPADPGGMADGSVIFCGKSILVAKKLLHIGVKT
jgi:hypothetical protein